MLYDWHNVLINKCLLYSNPDFQDTVNETQLIVFLFSGTEPQFKHMQLLSFILVFHLH